ncbi:GH12259 [Drosophila grimshawi]|uniref:GH12259 n=2 Tax=Drosophila grimshawi TaxID=7222 RepID=B4JJH1_DROGR|nr:GH12259 [Drosophila grimshawi]
MQLNESNPKVRCNELSFGAVALLGLFLCSSIVSINADKQLPGWLTPEIAQLAIGSDLNLTCTINQAYFEAGHSSNKACNVSDLYFTVNNKTIAIKGSQLQYINATTIQTTLRNVSDQDNKYVCMCKEHAMSESRLQVGTKPLPVEDFNCTSYDWDYMFCNFTAPRNSINTKYNVSFATQKDAFYGYTIDCQYEASPIVNCNITSETYKKFSELYYFELGRGNILGDGKQKIEINNVERMILARPGLNLRVLNKTKDSICLMWDMPRRSNFIGGVLWQVHVTPQHFPTLVRSTWRNSSSAAKDTLCLTELPYPGYYYLLELRVRNNKTKSRWSEPLEFNFRTVSERPARPPRLTNGSFYVYSSGASLTIYWEQLEQHEFNGDNFTYVISEYRHNNTRPDGSKIKLDANSATIQNWSQNAYHEIYLRSRNSVSSSLEASRIYIPPISDEDTHQRVPKKIRSIYISSNSSYKLSWTAPENITNLVDYTVYWCNAKPALLSKCNGSLHFEHVPKDRLQYSTQSGQPASLNMAVSANFGDRNTGMHWMMCTSDGNDDLAKMDPVIDELTNTSFTVKWSTERVCPVILTGYNLTYCQRYSIKADNCTTIVLNKDIIAYTINDLEPYTYYSVKMFMYSEHRASKYSDQQIKRTEEGAPTPPRQLEYLNVTSSSVWLAWKPPVKPNGVVREYQGTIWHDNKTEYFDLPASTVELVDNEKPIYYELSNLTAYTNYTISIRSHTVLYSDPSNFIHFRTAVGVPSEPMRIYLDSNPLTTTLEWDAPSRPAGRLEYYEVVIVERNSNNSVIGYPLSYVSARPNLTCVMTTPVCTSQHRFNYQVRAVNVEALHPQSPPQPYVAPNYERTQNCVAQPQLTYDEWSAISSYNDSSLYRLYKSAWATYEVSCSPDSGSTKMLLSSIEVFLAFIVLLVASHTGYRKYLKMSDIGVMLPTGVIEDLKKPKDIGSRTDGSGHGGGGGGGSMICTRVDQTPDYMPQYSLHDPPHDFSSGNESSKLLLANNSSNGGGGRSSPASYMSMDQGLLLDDEGQPGQGTELQPSGGNNATSAAASAGYIKPTDMKFLSTPMANTLPSSHPTLPMQVTMPFSGYVPVQMIQARPMPPVPTAIVSPLHPLNTSNYVHAADLHKLKSLAPITTTPATVTTAAPVQTAIAATSPPASATPMPNDFGYTSMEQLQRDGLMKPISVLAAHPQESAAAAAAAAAEAVQQTHHRLQPNIGGYVTPQDLNALAHNHSHML